MRVRNALILAHFFLLLTLFASVRCESQSTSDEPSTLLRQLQSRDTAEKAKLALLKKAETDPDLKKYLASNLPPIIALGSRKPTSGWLNAVKLAGELKISETADALATCIAIDNMGGEITAGSTRHLETIPAARALAQIGDPAIPALLRVLEHGTQRERRNAYLALNLIGSKLSMDSLDSHLENESDEQLKKYIREEVAVLHPSKKD